MEKFALALFLCLLLVASTTPVYGSITVKVLTNGSLGDRLINSPILILSAIIIANIIAVIYRKVRK